MLARSVVANGVSKAARLVVGAQTLKFRPSDH